jgi:hypothetical protein
VIRKSAGIFRLCIRPALHKRWPFLRVSTSAARRVYLPVSHAEGVNELADIRGGIARQRDIEQLAARYSTRRKNREGKYVQGNFG